MAEEIINALTKVEGLRVAARTSAFQFKGKSQDARQIGEALNVRTLLEGSVRTAGDRLRVTAQLINVTDGYHLWSDRYEKKMEDVFSIQDEITSRIVEALKMRLLSPRESPLVKAHPSNMEAYHLYLKGRHYRLSRYDAAKARQFFEQAVGEDPSYAPAFAGLADCYNHLGRDGFFRPNLARSKANEAVTRALALDDSSGEAHAVLAFTRSFLDWEWSDGEREFKRAIELDPACTPAYYWYCGLLANLGRKEEALTMARKVGELDPLAPVAGAAVGFMHSLWGDYDSSIAIARKVLEIHPDHALGIAGIGLSHSLLSQHEPAIAALEKAAALVARPPLMLAWLGRAYAVAGRRDQALEIAGELKDREYAAPLFQAWIYGGLRAKDEAFQWLAMAFEERSPWLAFFSHTKAMFHKDLRSDPRLDELARRMKLPDVYLS
jgi:serine/threonine-protein kinase